MNLISHTPKTSALVAKTEAYTKHFDQFKRCSDNILTLRERGAIDPGLNASSDLTGKAVTEFLQWTRTFTKEQWAAGVPLNRAALHAACGQGRSTLDAARRNCLIRVGGNRKAGEPDRYSLSTLHILGLAGYLAARGAFYERMAMVSMEQAETLLQKHDAIEQAVNPSLYAVEALTENAAAIRLGADESEAGGAPQLYYQRGQ